MNDLEKHRFHVSIPQETIDDLRTRLLATRWPTDIDDTDEYYGTSTAYMKELVDYWANEFDWRAAEQKLNEWNQYRVTVDGTPIHFVKEAGEGPAPIPLIMSHGWPWSYREWSKVIGPLTDPAAYGGDPADAFDVIVPSLAGFAFSTPTGRPDMNFWKMAELWHQLMTEHLGYPKYGAAGADYGALVSSQLGHKYADKLYGLWLGQTIHLDIFQGDRPWDITGGAVLPAELPDPIRTEAIGLQQRFAAHVAVHLLDNQNLAYGLADSPVGMLSWILRRWTKWSESNGDVESVFPREHLLTNATIWWVTNSITSSLRSYVNANRYPWQPSHDRTPIIEVPTGITFLGYENPPGVTTENRVQHFLDNPAHQGWYNPVYLKAHDHGGHFSPWENPEAVIEDIRATFRPLR
ncbi:epoxide hydrolase [Kribbella sp. ALI-6-A]|uniref:epoxide hydrolase family protein n=1 Tax=Kribbella sp. ALI-6-A TaxID=1933817 RepID=UPI00097C14AC|nr:epoxide hydrolase family protein [Kribbella sp. ALI-6-A]ONI74048.1 epoxide hydrolase [Kribbella sp. ALI-6-A]